MSRRDWIFLLVLAVLVLGGGAVYVAARKLGETEAGRLAKLRPQVRDAFERGRAELSAVHHIELIVVNTHRDAGEQLAKYAAGLSTHPSGSWHELDRGVDVQTVRNGVADPKAKDLDSYRKLHEVMKRHGFQGTPNGAAFNPDGSLRTFKNAAGQTISDPGHLEFTEGMTFAQAAARDRAVA